MRVICKCLAPVASAVMKGRLMSVYRGGGSLGEGRQMKTVVSMERGGRVPQLGGRLAKRRGQQGTA